MILRRLALGGLFTVAGLCVGLLAVGMILNVKA